MHYKQHDVTEVFMMRHFWNAIFGTAAYLANLSDDFHELLSTTLYIELQ